MVVMPERGGGGSIPGVGPSYLQIHVSLEQATIEVRCVLHNCVVTYKDGTRVLA